MFFGGGVGLLKCCSNKKVDLGHRIKSVFSSIGIVKSEIRCKDKDSISISIPINELLSSVLLMAFTKKQFPSHKTSGSIILTEIVNVGCS